MRLSHDAGIDALDRTLLSLTVAQIQRSLRELFDGCEKTLKTLDALEDFARSWEMRSARGLGGEKRQSDRK